MIQELITKVRNHKRIAIFSHVRPDGDAIGSQIGLALWVKKQGIEVFACNDDEVPENLIWLTEHFPITKPDEKILNTCDAFIFVDGNHLHRLGGFADYLSKTDKPIYMVDHHPDPQDIFDEMFSDPTASSTAEMVYRIILQSGQLHFIDKAIAEALYTGIVTDTGSFRFDSVTPALHEAVADILRRGKFNPASIHQRVYDNREFRHLKLIGAALNSITLFDHGKIATVTITEKILEETGCSYDDLDGIVSFPLSMNSVKVAVMLYERDDNVKISLRSKTDEADMNLVAGKFGGGGHKKAAGAWYNGSLADAVTDVVNEITFTS